VRRRNGEEKRAERPATEVEEAPAIEAEGEGGSEPTGLEPAVPSEGSELESLRAECDALKDRLLRKAAEFDNFRKRGERDRAQSSLDAAADVLKAVVPALDNLDRALQARGDEAALREGVELTRRELLASLEAKGVTVEDPVGQKFDPARHQALAHEPAPGFSEGDVVEVLRKGYSYQDRLLRPALVKVAKGGGAPRGEPDDKVH
jgi:molecular chaperone GrpE